MSEFVCCLSITYRMPLQVITVAMASLNICTNFLRRVKELKVLTKIERSVREMLEII